MAARASNGVTIVDDGRRAEKTKAALFIPRASATFACVCIRPNRSMERPRRQGNLDTERGQRGTDQKQ